MRTELVREIDAIHKDRRRKASASPASAVNERIKSDSSRVGGEAHAVTERDAVNERIELPPLMTIQRIDSADIIQDVSKLSRVKIVGEYYALGSVLGEGSYARVKEATDTRTLERVAVKIMKMRKLRRIPGGEENVRAEIAIQARLSHVNVVKLRSVFRNEAKGKIYLVLDYCPIVLSELMEKATAFGRFTLFDAHAFFRQLMAGIAYLHSRYVVHNDIKPGNLLLNHAGILKIADFGVAERRDMFGAASDPRFTGGGRGRSAAQGTPTFQPPEVAQGKESQCSYPTDIWAAGVTLFNFVTGDYPFGGDTVFRLYEAIAACRYVIPTHAPPNTLDPVLRSLLTSILVADPGTRPDARAVVAHDWLCKRQPLPPASLATVTSSTAASTPLSFGTSTVICGVAAEVFFFELSNWLRVVFLDIDVRTSRSGTQCIQRQHNTAA